MNQAHKDSIIKIIELVAIVTVLFRFRAMLKRISKEINKL